MGLKYELLSNEEIMELRPILNRPAFNLNKLSSSHLVRSRLFEKYNKNFIALFNSN